MLVSEYRVGQESVKPARRMMLSNDDTGESGNQLYFSFDGPVVERNCKRMECFGVRMLSRLALPCICTLQLIWNSVLLVPLNNSAEAGRSQASPVRVAST